MFVGIRLKLSLITLLLLTIITLVSSFIVMNIMDSFLLNELVKRGLSLSESAANAAAYSILSGDKLATDNLVAKLNENQEDIVYVAVVDHAGNASAHSDIKKTGIMFVPREGSTVATSHEGSKVKKIVEGNKTLYEFSTPILFSKQHISTFYLAIDGAALAGAQATARKKVLGASLLILFLGVGGVYFIAKRFTQPIQKLTESISELKSGKYHGAITVNLRDEIGLLTRNFNDMAGVIIGQRHKLEEYARGMEDSYLATVKILATSIDARDDYTLQHSTRVANLALSLGQKIGLTTEELRELEVAALVHDLGKIRVPDHILKKASPLTAEEYRLIQRHPQDGAAILVHSQALHKFIPAVLYHHEWYDGTGYPEGRKGSEIPLYASIIAIADAYDAMTTSRPYRIGLPVKHALDEILNYSGTQFDPLLVEPFVSLRGEWHDNRSLLTFGIAK